MAEENVALNETTESPAEEIEVEAPRDEIEVEDFYAEPEAPQPPAEESNTEKGDEEEAEHEQTVPYERFQEINTKYRTLEEKIAAMDKASSHANTTIEKLQAELGRLREPPKPQELPFKNITELTPDDVFEWQEKDPVGYAANLYKQMEYELMGKIGQMLESKEQKATLSNKFDSFVGQNEGFKEALESGLLNSIMNSDPDLHTPVSAWYAHKANSAQEQIAELNQKIEELSAAQEKAKELERIGEGASHAKVLSSKSRATPVHGADPRLKEPTKFGGIKNVLADMLREGRSRQ